MTLCRQYSGRYARPAVIDAGFVDWRLLLLAYMNCWNCVACAYHSNICSKQVLDV